MGPGRPRILESALAGVFVLTLSAPALDSVFVIDHSPPPQEKRQLAEAPRLPESFRTLERFPGSFDAWFGDHAGFRNSLILIQNHLKTQTLGMRPSPTVNAVFGKKGWLFYSGESALDYCEGRRPFTISELENWRHILQARHDWLSARGIKYMVVFAPMTASIYPEYLPDWVNRPVKTRLDVFLDYMKSHSTVEVVDTREDMRRAKGADPLYWRTDTHWNSLGAYVAYVSILHKLRNWFPNLVPVPLSDFAVRPVFSPGGDLSIMMTGTQGVITENGVVLFPGHPRLARDVEHNPYLSIRPWTLGTRPKITECSRCGEQGAVFLGDSYLWGLQPYLSEHFGRAAYLMMADFDPVVIEQEKPSVVVQEYLERALQTYVPSNPSLTHEPPAELPPTSGPRPEDRGRLRL